MQTHMTFAYLRSSDEEFDCVIFHLVEIPVPHLDLKPELRTISTHKRTQIQYYTLMLNYL